MSLNYSLFSDLGVLIKYYDLASSDAAALAADLADILDQFNTTGQLPAIDGLATQYGTTYPAAFSSRRTSLAGFATDRLQDPATILDVLGLPTTDIQALLQRLDEQMIDDAQTIKRSSVVAGGITADSGNQGNFVPLVTLQLDGITSPGTVSGQQLQPCHTYQGRATELCVPSDSLQLRCVADRFVDQVQDGSEQFLWSGGPAISAHAVGQEGSGQIGNVTCLHGRSIITGGDFETDDGAGTPTGWTVSAGTPGTNTGISAAHVYHATKALLLTPDGATAAITLRQAIDQTSQPQITARRMMACTARVLMAYTSGSLAGQLNIGLHGTGYSQTLPTWGVQTLQISGTPTGGYYVITCPWSGLTTGHIAYNAASSAVQTALRALAGNECVVVSTAAGSAPNITHQITLYGVPGIPGQITCNISGLTGGSPAQATAITTPAVPGDCWQIPTSALPTAWGLASFFIVVPEVVPSDLTLQISWSGTPAIGYLAYLDDMALGTVDYGGGHGLVVARGNLPAARDDRWQYPLQNTEGVIQRFTRRAYGRQLNSASSPSISDSVAT